MAKRPTKSGTPRTDQPTGDAAKTRPRTRRTAQPDVSARADAAGAPPAPSDSFAARTEPEQQRPPDQPVMDRPADAPAPPTESTSMASEPSEEDIRMRAYHLYLERGGGHGMDFEDWLRAKRELRELRDLGKEA
jgi:hypothetical protein